VTNSPAGIVLSISDSEALQESLQFGGLEHSTSSNANDSFGAALAQLYHERFRSLFRYLDRLSGDAQLAADVAQEAFFRLFQRGSMPDEPAAWLVTVASNLLRDDRRRVGRRLRLLEAASGGVPAASPPVDPAAAADREERRALVRAALVRLGERDREALLLRHAGYSYREIAGALGLAEASVGTILLRAGALFRSAYEEMHGAPD
jgi:RNA polymerase sigma-70 factor (ECF subfamily)